MRLWASLLTYPLAVASFYKRLADTFGLRFVLVVFAIYGLSQGIGESFAFYAMKYLFTDDPPEGFGRTAAAYQAFDGLSMFPWSCKALYGLISDTLPIGGRHRTPYIKLAGVLCLASFASLAATGPAGTPLLATLLMLLANLSMATPDVMLDAVVAGHCRTHPAMASDLQVLCWSSLGLCQMVGSAVKGSILHATGVRALFAVCAATGVAVYVPAALGWLGERRAAPGAAAARQRGLRACADVLWPAQTDPSTPLFRLALVITGCALTQGAIGVATTHAPIYVMPACGAAVCVVVVGSCWWFERRVSPTLAKASMYIFLDAAVQPHTLVIYKWCKATPSNCELTCVTNASSDPAGGGGVAYLDRSLFDGVDFLEGASSYKPIGALSPPAPDGYVCSGHDPPLPCFSPEFIGFMDVFASAAFVLGTAVYNRFLSAWSYRSILRAVQVVLMAVNMLDLVWTSRWNLLLGLPDAYFAMGYEVLQPLAKRSNLIPIFILAAKLCPPRAQATAFALNMGLANFGYAAGGYTGTALLGLLGGVEPPEFRTTRGVTHVAGNLRLMVVVRSLARLIPLSFIPLLVPCGSPQDDAFNIGQADESDLSLGESGAQQRRGGAAVGAAEERGAVQLHVRHGAAPDEGTKHAPEVRGVATDGEDAEGRTEELKV